MSKPKKDQNTDGKGADEVKDEAANADPNGSDTSAENDEGHVDLDELLDDESDDNPDPAKADKDEDDEVDPADEEGDSDPLPGDDGEKKFTQTDLNNLVTERLKKQKRSLIKAHDAEKTRLNSQIDTLKKQLGNYLKADKETLESELEALPESIREMAPGKLESAKGIAAVKRWLPKAKKLASEFGTRKPGNSGDPKPKGNPGKDEGELAASARKHSIYKSF